MKIQNNSKCSFLGRELLAEIYRTAGRGYNLLPQGRYRQNSTGKIW